MGETAGEEEKWRQEKEREGEATMGEEGWRGKREEVLGWEGGEEGGMEGWMEVEEDERGDGSS